MVLFDLNNVRGTAVAAGPRRDDHTSAFQEDVLAPVKTVKRLSSHPWPFPVKSDAAPHPAGPIRAAELASSFVTWSGMVKKTATAPVPAPKIEKRTERGASADFGEDGTNKTLPAPEAGAEPSAELQGTKAKYIPKTPYTRG